MAYLFISAMSRRSRHKLASFVCIVDGTTTLYFDIASLPCDPMKMTATIHRQVPRSQKFPLINASFPNFDSVTWSVGKPDFSVSMMSGQTCDNLQTPLWDRIALMLRY